MNPNARAAFGQRKNRSARVKKEPPMSAAFLRRPKGYGGHSEVAPRSGSHTMKDGPKGLSESVWMLPEEPVTMLPKIQ